MASMRNKGVWQDWLMLVIGLWLFCAPFFISYDSLNRAAAMNSYFAGGAVAIASQEGAAAWYQIIAGCLAVAGAVMALADRPFDLGKKNA